MNLGLKNKLNNVYKNNLDILIKRKPKTQIKVENWNIIAFNNSTYDYYFRKPNLINISDVLKRSFNQYFVLIPIMRNLEKIWKKEYNELDYEEYKLNVIKYLETAIDALNRYIIDNQNDPNIKNLINLKEMSDNQLNIIKNDNLLVKIRLRKKSVSFDENINIITNSDSYSNDDYDFDTIFLNTEYENETNNQENRKKTIKATISDFCFNIYQSIIGFFTRFFY